MPQTKKAWRLAAARKSPAKRKPASGSRKMPNFWISLTGISASEPNRRIVRAWPRAYSIRPLARTSAFASKRAVLSRPRSVASRLSGPSFPEMNSNTTTAQPISGRVPTIARFRARWPRGAAKSCQASSAGKRATASGRKSAAATTAAWITSAPGQRGCSSQRSASQQASITKNQQPNSRSSSLRYSLKPGSASTVRHAHQASAGERRAVQATISTQAPAMNRALSR